MADIAGKPDGSSGRTGAAVLTAGWLTSSRTTILLEASPKGVLRAANPAARDLLGHLTQDGETVCALDACLTEPDAERAHAWLRSGRPPEGQPLLLNFIDERNHPVTYRCWVEPADDGGLLVVGEPAAGRSPRQEEEWLRLNNELTTLARENARQGRELKRALDDLERSYWLVRKVHEVLPICMGCGKVKAGDAEWQDVVDFLKQHSRFLSHGYCPECADRVVRELDEQEV